MRMLYTTKGLQVSLAFLFGSVDGFVPSTTTTRKTLDGQLIVSKLASDSSNNNNYGGGDFGQTSSWSVADDWSDLSDANNAVDSGIVFDKDYAKKVADEMAAAVPKAPLSEEDIWLRDIVDEIQNAFSTLDEQPLYDTALEEPSGEKQTGGTMQDDMEHEIAMLIRCNEQPESMLIAEGRALPPLTQEEKDDVSQLVVLTKDSCKATNFMKDAVSNIFRQHATPSVFDGVLCLDAAGIASWMTTSLKGEGEGKVSPHDNRVLKTMSDYSSYGSGRLVEEEFQELYLSTVVGNVNNLTMSPERHLQHRKEYIDAVWRDIRAHGLLSPVEEERLMLEAEVRAKNEKMNKSGGASGTSEIVDECEILDWDSRASDNDADLDAPKAKSGKRISSRGQSSHKLLEMASDNKTPLRMRDGDFGELADRTPF